MLGAMIERGRDILGSDPSEDQAWDAMSWSEDGIAPMFGEDCPEDFRPAGKKRTYPIVHSGSQP